MVGTLHSIPAFGKKADTGTREIIRGQIHPALFFVFNMTFISFVQSVLLFLMAAPTYAILLTAQIEPEATGADYGFAAVQLSLVISEWFSDQQQWGKSNDISSSHRR